MGRLQIVCMACSREFEGRDISGIKAQKFCSVRCGQRYRRKKYNPDVARTYRYKGLTREMYDQLLEYQKGECAICYSTDPLAGGTWCIDHNHDTGEIRGLLCRACNAGIGQLKDNPNLVLRAYHYLMTPPSKCL